MTPAVILMVLGAAALHASWNAALRGGTDRLWAITVMSITGTVASIPVVAALPVPLPASWPYLGVSILIHVFYGVALTRAYATGDFGQVYPIARGSAPMLVTVGAVALAGETPPWPTLLGIALVSAGILGLARTKASRAAPLSLAAALVTGVSIATYTLADGLGARRAGDPVAYAFWLFLLYGMAMWLTFRLMRGRWRPEQGHGDAGRAVGGGLVSLVAYVAVIWAASVSPMGPVSALRETSVVMAAVIARVVFGEPLTLRRLGACVVIALGGLLIGWR